MYVFSGRLAHPVVDNMACSGEEETLLDCRHGKWGECEPLTYYGDAGVICNPFGQHIYNDRILGKKIVCF